MNPAMPSPGVVQSACPLAPSSFHPLGTRKEKERSPETVFVICRSSAFLRGGKASGWPEAALGSRIVKFAITESNRGFCFTNSLSRASMPKIVASGYRVLK
jgi:hypothetical protein